MSYVAPWVVLTALAVMLSWFGVRDVVRDAVSDRAVAPVAVPVPQAVPTPGPSPVHDLRTYSTRGGRAVLTMTSSAVAFVSANAAPGYRVRVSRAEGWLRVDFLRDRHGSSVIATWYQDRPAVRTYDS